MKALAVLLSSALVASAATSITPPATRVTTECFSTVVYGRDTNSTLSVSNAGLAAVNGLYRTNLLNGYTQGIYKIAFSPTFGSFVVSNASQEVYGFDSFGAVNIGDGVQWSDDFLSNPPLPTSWWGPINVTNCFSYVASTAPLNMPTVSSNLYVSESGNDTNAQRGRIDRPWRNVQLALLSSRPGDKVIVGAGVFTNPATLGSHFYVSNRVSLIGAGMGTTLIGIPGTPEENLLCASEVVLRDFTFYGSIRMGAAQMNVASTNCLIDRCEILGTDDIIHVRSYDGTLTVSYCKGLAAYDGLADFENRTGGSNRVIRLINCDFALTNNGSANPLRLIKGNDTRIEIFGGSYSIIGYAAPLNNAMIYMDVDSTLVNNSGSVLCNNVRFFRTTTNASALLVTNFLQRTPIYLENCTMDITRPTLNTGSYTNGWYDRQVAMPNGAARTNRLVDVRSLTNALVQASEQGHTITVTDEGLTAAGTNVWIATSAGQHIISGGAGLGPLQTNITVNGGSATFRVVGTNWALVNNWP